MATTAQIQVPAVPTTEDTALTLLQYLYASSGVVTDSNIGSVVRTYSEAIGSVNEIEGISIQTEAFQALVYSAYSAFNISPLPATSAVGVLTFSTISGTPMPAGQSVGIPSGTLAPTSAGIQYTTTSAVILASGQINVNAPIQAVTPGSNTNTPANTINQLLSSLTYPLSITNLSPVSGGNDAKNPDQTQARFTDFVQSIGLASPIAIANGVIGISYGQEIVKYSTVFEAWIQQIEEGSNPCPGFSVIIDNGTGYASPGLISAVNTVISSGSPSAPVGYRPAGVPYTTSAVIPVSASSFIVATVIDPNNTTQMGASMTQAVAGYFDTLNFGDSAELTQLIASIANISFGQLSALSVTLEENHTGTSVIEITAGPTSRIILQLNSVIINTN